MRWCFVKSHRNDLLLSNNQNIFVWTSSILCGTDRLLFIMLTFQLMRKPSETIWCVVAVVVAVVVVFFSSNLHWNELSKKFCLKIRFVVQFTCNILFHFITVIWAENYFLGWASASAHNNLNKKNTIHKDKHQKENIAMVCVKKWLKEMRYRFVNRIITIPYYIHIFRTLRPYFACKFPKNFTKISSTLEGCARYGAMYVPLTLSTSIFFKGI